MHVGFSFSFFDDIRTKKKRTYEADCCLGDNIVDSVNKYIDRDSRIDLEKNSQFRSTCYRFLVSHGSIFMGAKRNLNTTTNKRET